MKICFAGAGALGCAIGGTLRRGGLDVWLVDRNARHIDAIRRRGLSMRTEDGEVSVAIDASTSFEDVGIADVVIVLVKSFATADVIRAALPAVGPGTVVMSLQNGLGHEEILIEAVGRERVVAGKTYAGGVMLGPGRVIAGTRGKETIIGELDGTVTPRVQGIAEAFCDAGIATIVSHDIMGTIWDKVLVNVATGAVSGITGLEYGDLYKVPEIEETALAAVAEAMAVAKASGVGISCTDPKEPWIKAAAGLPADFKTSMLQSIEKNSTTEIDFINGAVVRWGRRCGVPTPVNRALVAGIKGLEYRIARLANPGRTDVAASKKAYVEHVAIHVCDIHWHIRFFSEVLGMTMREVDGPLEDPRQYWTLGGMQFIASQDFAGPEGRLAHLGVMCEDLEAALEEARKFGVTELPQGRNWLRLPDGLALELIQARGDSVARALAVDPRA
jgi:2-dehydropantoate 2-reductase